MTTEDKTPEASEETMGETGAETGNEEGAEDSIQATGETAPEPPAQSPLKSEEKSLETKIELLVNVAMLTIMTLMRLVKEKGPDAIGEAEMAQFDKVRESVQMAADAVDEWSKEEDSEGKPLDLSRMRAKLDVLQRKIDEWPLDQAAIDSTPPS